MRDRTEALNMKSLPNTTTTSHRIDARCIPVTFCFFVLQQLTELNAREEFFPPLPVMGALIVLAAGP